MAQCLFRLNTLVRVKSGGEPTGILKAELIATFPPDNSGSVFVLIPYILMYTSISCIGRRVF